MIDFFNDDVCVSKIITACYVPAGKGDSVFNDRHSHGLALNISGSKEYHFGNGRILKVASGDIIYLPKHSDYVVVTVEQGNCYCINFDIHEDTDGEPFVFHTKNMSSFVDRYKRAVPVWTKKETGCVSLVKAQLHNIIYLMQTEYYAAYVESTKAKKILPATEYIREHFLSEIISIEYLAELCGMTSVYFRSIFKSLFAVSPIAYINNLKINHAKELLGSGMYTVSEAASLSGYTDPCHFSREFKKAVGVPPSEYLKG
jgi:AraC-like DNA-binding protein